MRISDWSSDVAKNAKGAAAWGLLSAAVDPARMQAEELRQRLDALRFAKIPGYFPTPAELIARMIDAAGDVRGRSEEHTSELQSLMRTSYAVFCLKKKINQK